jgi:hypothetical protein
MRLLRRLAAIELVAVSALFNLPATSRARERAPTQLGPSASDVVSRLLAQLKLPVAPTNPNCRTMAASLGAP